MKITIETKETGVNGYFEIVNQLNKLVEKHWRTLFEGAVRLRKHINEDYYAPERIQINKTRLHYYQGVKYADGWKYSYPAPPTKEQLVQTVKDIQTLFDAAAENIKPPFTLTIK